MGQFIENPPSEINILINEVDFIDESFEIYNREERQIDLSGWIITDQQNIYKIDSLLLEKGGFAVFHYNNLVDKIDSVKYSKMGVRISSFNNEISLYDRNKNIVDRVSLSLAEDRSIYARNIPFEEFDGISFEWTNVQDHTIGFHNETYTKLLEEKRIRFEEARKRKRILTAAIITCVILIPVILIVR